MGGFVRDRGRAVAVPQLITEHPDVASELVGGVAQRFVAIVASHHAEPIDEYEPGVEVGRGGALVRATEASADHILELAFGAADPPPDIAIGPRVLGGKRQRTNRSVLGERVESDGHQTKVDVTEIHLGGNRVTNLVHDLVDVRTRLAAVGSRECVQSDLASRVFAGDERTVVASECIAGSESNAGQHLDRFEDRKGQSCPDEQREAHARHLEPSGEDEAFINWIPQVSRIDAMRRIWWIPIIIASLVFLYFTALPGDLAVGRDSEDGIAGTYTVNGLNPLGEEYSGTAVIVATDSGFDVEWIVTGVIQRGTGNLEGSTFTTTWEATSAAAGGAGRSIYVIQSDGSLVGERFIDGVDEPGTEELFPEA